jgi:hypothetical protein
LTVVFTLSLLRAITSFSLIIAYQNIASGVASTIHFMYPLAVALVMMFVFREKKSLWVIVAVLMSLSGASVLSLGGVDVKDGFIQGFRRHEQTSELVEDKFVNGFYILNKEIIRACKENDIYTNWLMILSKYPKKILGLLKK